MKTFHIDMIRENIDFYIQDGVGIFSQLRMLLDVDFDFDVYLPTYGRNLQRDLCWNLQQKQELILSILKGIRLPKVCIVMVKKDNSSDSDLREDFIYQVIDGKQRITTIISFLKDEFPIVINGEEFYHKDLGEHSSYIDNEVLIGDQAFHYPTLTSEKYNITDNKKISWFKMINFSGTQQDKDYMNGFIIKK